MPLLHIDKYYLTSLPVESFLNTYVTGRYRVYGLATIIISVLCSVQFLIFTSFISFILIVSFLGLSTLVLSNLNRNDFIPCYQFDHLYSIGGPKFRSTLDLLKHQTENSISYSNLTRLKLIFIMRQKGTVTDVIGDYDLVTIAPDYLDEYKLRVSDSVTKLNLMLNELLHLSPSTALFTAQQAVSEFAVLRDTTFGGHVSEDIDSIHRLVSSCDHGASFFHRPSLFRIDELQVQELNTLISSVLTSLDESNNEKAISSLAKELIINCEESAFMEEKFLLKEINKILKRE